MISATGRIPVIAAPIAAPTIACSEIGVSQTRARAELVEQADGRLEHALGRADVLAEADHGRVAPHLPRDALGDRLAIGDRRGVRYVRHAAPPSAQTSVSASAGSAAGAAFAAATASATSALGALVDCRRPRSGDAASVEPGAREVERVALDPLLDLLGGAVLRRVGRGCARSAGTSRASMTVGPSPARARSRGRGDRVVHHHDVVAVDHARPACRTPAPGRPRGWPRR